MSTDETYFIAWKGRRDGPYSLIQLEELLKNGDVGLLHSVETSSGQVTLKDLLQTAEMQREGAKATAYLASPGTTSSAESDDPFSAVDEREAIRAYTICGLCFLLPPLVLGCWKIARNMTEQGHAPMAQRLKLLSASLAGGGLLMWIVMWRFW